MRNGCHGNSNCFFVRKVLRISVRVVGKETGCGFTSFVKCRACMQMQLKLDCQCELIRIVTKNKRKHGAHVKRICNWHDASNLSWLSFMFSNDAIWIPNEVSNRFPIVFRKKNILGEQTVSASNQTRIR